MEILSKIMQILNKNSVVIIPILTTLFVYLTGRWTDNKKTSRALREKQLVELYNELHTICLQNKDLFSKNLFGVEKVSGVATENPDGSMDEYNEVYFEIPDNWKDVYVSIQTAVYKKIHLLEYEDMKIWYHVEYTMRSIESNKEFLESQTQMRYFANSVIQSFGKIYHEFQNNSKWAKKRR